MLYCEVEGEGWVLSFDEWVAKKKHFGQPIYIDSVNCSLKGQWKQTVSKQ